MSLPTTTRAAVLREFGAPLVIEEVPLPRELEPGSLLVEVLASTLCGTDVHLTSGELSLPVELPAVPGHEMTGRVVGIGSGADVDSFSTPLAVGDRVTWTHAYCGRCRMCSAKTPALCTAATRYGFQSPARFPFAAGGLARHCYVFPRSGRVRVPDDIPDAWASMSSCALRTVVNAVRQAGRIDITDTVVVQGCGPLGVLATGAMRVGGAGTVVTVGAPAARLAIAREFGADETISLEEVPDPGARTDRVRELTDGRGADVVFDFSGVPSAFAEGVDMLRVGGRYVVVGQLGTEPASFLPSLITTKNLTVQGIMSADVDHYHGALEFLRRHRDALPFDRLFSGRHTLDDVNDALAAMRAMTAMKPLVTAH